MTSRELRATHLVMNAVPRNTKTLVCRVLPAVRRKLGVNAHRLIDKDDPATLVLVGNEMTFLKRWEQECSEFARRNNISKRNRYSRESEDVYDTFEMNLDLDVL